MIRFAAAAVACLLSCAAAAASVGPPVVAVSLGTLGAGIEVRQPLIPQFLSLALQAHYLEFSHDFVYDETRYFGHARLLSGGALLNLQPFGNGFKLSGGLYVNGNRFRADTTQPIVATDPLLGFSLPIATHGEVRGKFRPVAPYAGAGWTWGTRFPATLDLGVLFQGKVTASADLDCVLPFCNALAEQQKQDLINELRQYRWYPVLRFTLGYAL
ncbi:hypothetical protein [Nevskia sp.]|uniref:hypothetical protein n=1 Tax=Nevskia sp. TaxID=1929292 RepID=UPI0025D9C9E3|nr:hypothetical protein [Nevskia sp.]